MTFPAMLVVAKAPEPGRAKTRLAPAVGDAAAAEIAAASLLDTLQALGRVPGPPTFVAWTGDTANAVHAAEISAALARTAVLTQRGGGLGERLADAHTRVGAATGGPVFQIGMDTPQLAPDLVTECAGGLREPGGPDAVLGPAADGGWWALGLRDPRAAAVLREVPMSREDTGQRTEKALREAGLRVRTLPMMSDVDTVDDAVRVAAGVPGSRFATAVDACTEEPA
ncbi:DUF2064 domain-containing protein [Saccharopolyspora sp. HNM0983]|uniref:DUF2064 domain-containing protein n=1 Tax=Saccharopolyspora montiporae TaxID=2781240 RepID=A0A929B8N2_9PSEU|nr:DUF2064 domain-containing protein [Saccharopolyspora sp. HNM0983]MBE9373855.1 DUF2064 domain-containing protein [Saccharopolyspora sp. HNM0983]